MIDFPIGELLDEDECLEWLERYLHPDGLECPRCGSGERRVAQRNGRWSAYRCKACDRYHSILTGTVFEKTRQAPSTIVLILRGIAKGETTACLARELGVGRPRMHEIRKQVQTNLRQTLPSLPMIEDEVLEADELYQNAGEKRRTSRRPRRSAQAARQ
jgi:transposase-like protein